MIPKQRDALNGSRHVEFVRCALLLDDHILGGHRSIHTWISFSSPWDGHQAETLGVKFAPKLIPVWFGIAHDLEFLTAP